MTKKKQGKIEEVVKEAPDGLGKSGMVDVDGESKFAPKAQDECPEPVDNGQVPLAWANPIGEIGSLADTRINSDVARIVSAILTSGQVKYATMGDLARIRVAVIKAAVSIVEDIEKELQ